VKFWWSIIRTDNTNFKEKTTN